MIIHHPEIIHQDDHTVIWAKIELARKRERFPDYFWYRIPTQYAESISLQSDAFLAPGLLAAMHFGEDIRVRGVVSPRLAYHLDEYQFILNFWMPKDVQPVEIQFDQLSPVQASPKGVGCAFSGGVDSWFTVLQHLPENQPIPDYQLTHALYIKDFDILKKEAEKSHRLFTRYQQALQQIDIELIPLETNLVSFIIPRLKIVYFFSPVLVGCAMLLQGLFKRFYISSARDHRQIMKRVSSSSPLTERLLSTDTLDIIHYGSIYKRFEKIEAISDWDLARQNLRVCAVPNLEENVLNCSRCEKCTRTMAPIYALGRMKEFTTFVKPFKSNFDVLRWARKFSPTQVSLPDLFAFVREHKPDLIPWLHIAVLMGSIRYRLLNLIPEPIKKWLQRYGYYVDPFKQENAFEDPEMIRLIRSMDVKTPAEIKPAQDIYR
jgi:hypothetical protein